MQNYWFFEEILLMHHSLRGSVAKLLRQEWIEDCCIFIFLLGLGRNSWISYLAYIRLSCYYYRLNLLVLDSLCHL
jgi:hypothetical protein